MLRIGRLGPSQAVALRCALPVGFGLQPCHPSFLFLLKLTLLNLWPQTCNASFGLDTAFFSYSMSNHCLLQSSVHGAAWTLQLPVSSLTRNIVWVSLVLTYFFLLTQLPKGLASFWYKPNSCFLEFLQHHFLFLVSEIWKMIFVKYR